MAGLDNGSLVAQLIGLVKSPRVQHLGGQLKSTAQNYGAQPLTYPGSIARTGSRKPTGGGGQTGASANIGSMLGQIAGGLNQQVQQEQDPMMALYAQLLDQLQQPVQSPTGIDKEDLMRQVQSAINPIYDQRIDAAQGQYERGSEDVQGMYKALSNDFKELAPEQVAQAAQNKQDIEALYGQLRTNINGDYARISKEQGDLFKQLGIEAALPDVMADQQAPVQDALIAASENQAQQQQRYQDIGQMDASFYREGSPIALMQGNEISVDLLNQLNEYVNQANAERTSGIQSGYMDQLSQAQNQLMQQQQMGNQETGRRQEMLFQMLNAQMQGQGKQQELTPDSFMGQLPPQVQSQVAGAFTQLQRSPEAVYGKVKDPRNPVPGTYVETTPEWYMAQADEMLKRGQIDETTHQALLMYLQLNFGN